MLQSCAASLSETLVTFGFSPVMIGFDGEFYLKLPAESEIAECVQLCYMNASNNQ